MRGYTHLVVMTNKDIYRVNSRDYRILLGALADNTPASPTTFSFTDEQTQATITIATAHVSALSRRKK